jgi:hypothetical protein
MFDSITDIITVLIAILALVLSIVNARSTWWKPFCLEIYPYNIGWIRAGIDSSSRNFAFKISTTLLNTGSKPGLVARLALVQLDNSMKMLEKIHISYFLDQDNSEAKEFAGLFLKAGQTYYCDAVFEGEILGSMAPKLEDWHLVYQLTSEEHFRLTDTIISVDLKCRGGGYNLDKNGFHFADMRIMHAPFFNREIKDTLPEISPGRG